MSEQIEIAEIAPADVTNGMVDALSSNEVAVKALKTSEGARVLVAYIQGRPVGAASFRLEDGVKLINIGSVIKRIGVGRALVNEVRKRAPGRLWCRAKEEARPFYEVLGMRPDGSLPDGRTVYRMPE
jgi:hypothetical protein